MSRRLVLALVAVAAGLALLLFVTRSAHREESAPATIDAAPREPELALAAASPEATTQSEPQRAAQDAGASADPRAPLLLRVVRDADGAPIPGAEVFQLDEPRAVPFVLERSRRSETNDLATLARRFGRVRRTDLQGEVRLPWPDPRMRVGAAAAGQWGEMIVEHGSDGIRELRLHDARALDVIVVDAAGAPTGNVPVVLRSRTAERYVEHAWQRTDAAGRARFERVDLESMNDGNSTALFVGLRLLLAQPAQVELDPEAWPGAPVTIALPPTGSVVFELVDAAGALVPIGGEVDLALGTRSAEALVAGGNAGLHDTPDVDLHDGRARIERVGLGLDLSAIVWANGWSHVAASGDGPTATGETVTLPIRLEERVPLLSGRAFDGVGKALAEQTLLCEFWPGEDPNAARMFESTLTGADGRFTGLGQGFLMDEHGWSIRLVLAGSAPESSAELGLPLPMPEGEVALGDVVLDVPPLLAIGRVLDDVGEPVPGAGVRVQRRDRHPMFDSMTWMSVPGARTFSDATGAFELRGRPTTQPLQVTAERLGYLEGEPMAIVTLPASADLVLARGGAVEGRLVRPPGVAKASLVMSLTAGSQHSGGRLVWLDDERFRFVGLSAGLHVLSVKYMHDQGMPHLIEGIAVMPPEPTRDGRLDPLDLARVSHVHRVIALDKGGGTIPDARVDLPSANSPRWEEVPQAAGSLEIVSFREVLPRVRVRAPGRRPAELSDVAGEARVELASGPRVRLVARDSLTAPESGWRIQAVLTCDKLVSDGLFDEHGEAEVVVCGSGRHELVLAACRLVDGKPWRTQRLGKIELPIDVRESSDAQVFTLPPLPETILERLRELR